jgi:hypothetical protein
MKHLALIFSTLALLAVLAFVPVPNVSGAPAAQITPVAVTNPLKGEVAGVMRYFNTVAVTADTRVCQDLGAYRVADIQYIADHGTSNPVTITLQHSNNNSNFTNGQRIVVNSTADGNALNRYDLYGKFSCVFADVTNSNSLTLTILVMPRS